MREDIYIYKGLGITKEDFNNFKRKSNDTFCNLRELLVLETLPEELPWRLSGAGLEAVGVRDAQRAEPLHAPPLRHAHGHSHPATTAARRSQAHWRR